MIIEKIIEKFSSYKKDLHFFDANCWIGRSNSFTPVSISKTNEIIEQMNYYGIERAIVSHTLLEKCKNLFLEIHLI